MHWDSLMNCQEAQRQKHGQEDQGEVKERRGVSSLAGLRSHGPHGLPSGSGLPGKSSSYPNPSTNPYIEAYFEGLP